MLTILAGNSPEKQNAATKDSKNDMRKADPNSAYLTMKNGLDESIINRELLTKMHDLNQMIKNIQDENKFLKGENQRLRDSAGAGAGQEGVAEEELHAVIFSYQRKAREMSEQIAGLETRLELVQAGDRDKEKSRYKPLARKLKEERNVFRDMLEKVNMENKVLKEEIEKMKSLADKLKSQCKSLKLDIGQKKAAAPGASSEVAEAACQTDAVPELSAEEATKVPPLDVAPEAESPDTEDEEKQDFDQYLDEFLVNSLNVAADDNLNKVDKLRTLRLIGLLSQPNISTIHNNNHNKISNDKIFLPSM